MPEETKLVTLLRKREELDERLTLARDRLLSMNCALLEPLVKYEAAWRNVLANAKAIAVEEILHDMQIQIEQGKKARKE